MIEINQVTHCDGPGCGKKNTESIPGQRPDDWKILQFTEVVTDVLDDHTNMYNRGNRHFCSFDCVAKWCANEVHA